MLLQQASERDPVLTKGARWLCFYPHNYWTEFKRRIGALSPVDPKIQQFRRLVLSSVKPCAMDRQGRIVIPGDLRKHAGLERDVMVAGIGPYLELWDSARFDAESDEAAVSYVEIASEVAAKMGDY